MYRIIIQPKAEKNLLHIPLQSRERISKVLDDIAENPYPKDSIKLKSNDKLRRYRVGNYRIVYEIVENELVVYVINIDHRKDVYKNL